MSPRFTNEMRQMRWSLRTPARPAAGSGGAPWPSPPPAGGGVAQDDADAEGHQEVAGRHGLQAVDVGKVRTGPQALHGQHGADEPQVHERDAPDAVVPQDAG